MSDENKTQKDGWERDLLQQLATDALKERRRSRRWGVFFKLLTFAYIGLLIYLVMPDSLGLKEMEKSKAHTALVDMEGVISPAQGVDADTVVEGLRDAFKDKNTKAVILRINSPGGSPVQSSYIQKEIVRLKKKYEDIPLYAVVSDICASGGYYVASAADRIYVNESSILGSIGVLMNGFGFTGAMDELGIERRLMTAGEHKGILDPFSPMSEFDRAHAQELLEELHRNFIDVVKQGRGERLSESEELFSGLFWSGPQAIELGLADEIGSAGYVAREVVGEERIVDFTQEDDPLERLADRLGAAAASTFAEISGLIRSPRM
jgi:protease-4